MSEGEPTAQENMHEGVELEYELQNEVPRSEQNSDSGKTDTAHEQNERSIVQEFAAFLTPEEMSEYAEEDRETIVSYIFDKALGQTVVDAIPDAMWDRICSRTKSSDAIWEVIGKMKAANRGDALESDLVRREKVIRMFNKNEAGVDKLESAPTGFPSTEEAVAESRGKTGVRKLAANVAGVGKFIYWTASTPVKASQHLALNMLSWKSRGDEKWMDKYNSMSPKQKEEHLRKTARRATLIALAGGAIYLGYRAATGASWLPWDHHNGDNQSGLGSDGDHGNHDMPEIAPGNKDYVYDPNLDPARDPAKHHNDWGPALKASPEDGSKPAGYADFFNNRLKHSPEELSATLSEFGLNGKDAHAINDLANQMAHDPKLFEQKYNQLMNLLNDPKTQVSLITDARDYGSYYAVANPDGTVTLSYDTYVSASGNLQTYGPQGNDFMKVVAPDGSVHYAHIGCGNQWSQFINPAPRQAPQHTVSAAPTYVPQDAPRYSSSSPVATPSPATRPSEAVPPPVAPPPDISPPPEVIPPDVPPPSPPPPPPPHPPAEIPKGVEEGPAPIHRLPVDDYEPTPAPVRRSSTVTSPNGVPRTESINSPVTAPNANRAEGTTASQLHSGGTTEAPSSSALHGAAKKPE